jgi:hypothetical protein
MMHAKFAQILDALSKLDFTSKGEAFVEQKFVTPLLECLGTKRTRIMKLSVMATTAPHSSSSIRPLNPVPATKTRR